MSFLLVMFLNTNGITLPSTNKTTTWDKIGVSQRVRELYVHTIIKVKSPTKYHVIQTEVDANDVFSVLSWKSIKPPSNFLS